MIPFIIISDAEGLSSEKGRGPGRKERIQIAAAMRVVEDAEPPSRQQKRAAARKAEKLRKDPAGK